MITPSRQPIYREEDGELLGYISIINSKKDTWKPETIFGYPLATPCPHPTAVSMVKNIGLSSLLETWEFKDPEDGQWYNCQITEAHEHQVRVNISDFGHPRVYTSITVTNPTPENFRCSRILVHDS